MNTSKRFIVVTSDLIPGRQVVETLGLVRGNTIRARHIGNDIMAGLRTLVGGEIHEYGKLLAESREQALDRMVAEGEKLGADAIVGLRPEEGPPRSRRRPTHSQAGE